MSHINIDASSLFFTRNLATTNNNIAKTLQRLSTGLKINQAKDDAAGLSLSEKITTNINALDGYYRNSQDGLSYLQIADSSLQSIGDDLQRMRELALQAANGIYSDGERTALQDEINERIKNINQIKDSTSFSKKEIFKKEQHNYSASVVASGTTANITINADTATIVVKDSSGAVIDPADYSIVSNAGDGYISISTAGLGNQSDFTVEYAGTGDVKNRIETQIEVLKGGLQSEVPVGYTAITSAAELQAITSGDLAGNYILMNDIDVSGISNWERLGSSSTAFSGIFDGNGFKVTGLNLNKPAVSFQGLFGVVDGGQIKNLGIENATVIGQGSVGILAGSLENGALIENCYTEGSILGNDSTGGLVGEVDNADIKNSYFNGSVEGRNYTGGLVGYLRNSSSLENSYSSAGVTSENGVGVGVLVGFSSASSIDSTYSIGSASAENRTGGLVGWLINSTVSNSYTKASVYSDNRTGGFAGEIFNSNLNNVYSAGSVSSGGAIGSFTGHYSGTNTLIESYSNISTAGVSDLVGNFVANDVTGISDEQMRDSSTFSSWDSNKWFTNDISYPVLLGTPNFDYGQVGYGNLVDISQSSKKIDSTVNTAIINTGVSPYEFDQNQDIFNTKITLATDENKVYTEGVDYKISENSGSNYLNIINSELLNADINLEYESAYNQLDQIINQQDGALTLKTDDDFDLGIEIDTLNLDLSGRLNLDLTSAGGARVALAVIDANLNYINSKRAAIGAKMNALEALMDNNRSSKEALINSRTVIRDADFAKETAILTQKQVMQEFNVSAYKNMMSANQGLVLMLLNGIG